MDDLVQRLRAKYTVTDEFSTIRRPVNPDGHEAADRIEALEAELATCRAAMAVMDNTVAELEAGNETLRRFRASFAPGVAEKLFGSHGE